MREVNERKNGKSVEEIASMFHTIPEYVTTLLIRYYPFLKHVVGGNRCECRRE